jgi:hypothetical protein
LAAVLLGGGVVGWAAAAAALAVPVITGCASSAANAGVAAITIASGLAAATKRQREEVLIINTPLQSGHVGRAQFDRGLEHPSPGKESIRGFRKRNVPETLYIRIQDAKISLR